MKPKAPNEHEDGLLEYLEDIIGTSKYKVPIEKMGEEVERLNEVRSHCNRHHDCNENHFAILPPSHFPMRRRQLVQLLIERHG